MKKLSSKGSDLLGNQQTGISEEHTVWAYAFVMLEVHLMVARVPGEALREGSFRDMCVSACMLLRDVQIW